MPDTSINATSLIAMIAADLDRIRVDRAALSASLATSASAVVPHPSYPAYIFGGLLKPFGFDCQHILSMLGLMHEPTASVVARCTALAGPDAPLAITLHGLCETDARLEVSGLDICREHGLLKRDRIDGFWLKRPALGLGQAAKLFGFEPQHADAMRGVLDLRGAAITDQIAPSAAESKTTVFGAAIFNLAANDTGALAIGGAAALHAQARDQYFEKRASFEAYIAKTGATAWRSKPPLSRQGHLAVTTAQAKGVPAPAKRQRGAAADWLENNGANIRFIDGDRK